MTFRYCNINLLSHYCYFTVRLVGGPTKYEGNVEVYHNGEWGTVCHYGWDLNDAQVVCNELNFGPAVAVRYNAFYGLGGFSVWLSFLQCDGTEWSIGNCSHSGWGVNCHSRYSVAGVKCLSGNILG